jgi:hypothetical protein
LKWWYLKAKIVQDCKEPEVKMYKPIWDLVFKCNGSGRQFNSIQFSQEYNNQINEKKEKKRSNKNTRCNGVRFKNAYVSGTPNLQQFWLSQNTKKQFYTCRTWPLTQKWATKPIGNKSNNTLKKVSDNTLKTKMSDNTLKKKNEHYNSKKVYKESKSQMIKL